ncbi:potassium channel family protein [Spirilliplanes yamanashiensis]|uniref:Potassium transporter n=1 Tax=Spirilliplanes yamanashiensis TaxID=42233 RepID=A0A8J3Y7I9_9ACTN|nr:TrkA family potassium uptake protein [Spirilliplanes yamanashiensis]MDP9817475.1 trk system potassium uptake protein TrkA [Spirilliplanes yamanashiensis]GIJ02872.1 potassium transporter [Spirilliplanes yamanashiensis]
MSADNGTGTEDNVVVIGLGRFGGAVAKSLLDLGHEVLGIDENQEIVQDWGDRLTHVAAADSTDEDALRQLGVPDFTRAVVGIGSNIEASVLTVVALTELGVGDITAKASSSKHGKILRSIGVHHVVYPEQAMGERVAHLITGKMLDFIEFDDGFAIAKVRAPRDAAGRSLADVGLRTHYGVTVVGVKRPGADFEYARPETVVPRGCTLIVAGPTASVERFAAVT